MIKYENAGTNRELDRIFSHIPRMSNLNSSSETPPRATATTLCTVPLHSDGAFELLPELDLLHDGLDAAEASAVAPPNASSSCIFPLTVKVSRHPRYHPFPLPQAV